MKKWLTVSLFLTMMLSVTACEKKLTVPEKQTTSEKPRASDERTASDGSDFMETGEDPIYDDRLIEEIISEEGSCTGWDGGDILYSYHVPGLTGDTDGISEINREIDEVVAVLFVKGIISLPGGGKSDDPNLGEWKAVSAEASGVSVGVEDTFGGDFIIDLKKGGKAGITMGDQKASAKWTLEEEKFTIKGGGLDCAGSLKNGVLTLENVLDTGINLTFEKVGGYQGGSETGSESGSGDSAGNASGTTYFVLDLDATTGMDEELASAGEDAGYAGFERLKDGSYIYYVGTLKVDCEIKDGALLFSGGEDMGMGIDMGTVTDHGQCQ